MVDMPHPRMPHLHREVTRHGAVVWYARVGGSSRGPRVTLKAEFGNSENRSDAGCVARSASNRCN
jgi:hypothetical protein